MRGDGSAGSRWTIQVASFSTVLRTPGRTTAILKEQLCEERRWRVGQAGEWIPC